MRLIDADLLTNRIKEYCEGCNSYGGAKCRACYIGDCLDAIDDSPTAYDVDEVIKKLIECAEHMRKYSSLVSKTFEKAVEIIKRTM